MNRALTQQRIRIKFGKYGALRFVGHLDLSKTWERVLRRAQMPLEYTQGFNPRPRYQFAAALVVGITSESEYLDVWLTERLGGEYPDEWVERLVETSLPGLRIDHIKEVPIRGPALPTLVTSAEYVVTPIRTGVAADDLQRRVETLLAAAKIERVRRDKMYDLRPLILGLSVDADGQLIARLTTGDKGNARPDELLDALGFTLSQVRVHRRHLFLRGGSEQAGRLKGDTPRSH